MSYSAWKARPRSSPKPGSGSRTTRWRCCVGRTTPSRMPTPPPTQSPPSQSPPAQTPPSEQPPIGTTPPGSSSPQPGAPPSGKVFQLNATIEQAAMNTARQLDQIATNLQNSAYAATERFFIGL